MNSYIIDIWKDGELVQSVAGRWIEDEARRMTFYYLGYYRADRAQLLRDRADKSELVAEVLNPQNAGETILW
jgi:hypothetical protein